MVTPVVRSLAMRVGLVDTPDGRRKMHAKPIPVAGGVAVLITSALALSALFVFAGPIKGLLKEQLFGVYDMVTTLRPELIGLAIAAGIIGLVGVADDLWGLRGWHKFLGQLVAVGVVIWLLPFGNADTKPEPKAPPKQPPAQPAPEPQPKQPPKQPDGNAPVGLDPNAVPDPKLPN